jgi:hypothetical protein
MRSSTLQVLYLFGSLAYASAIPDATAKEDLIAREDFKVADSLDARAACKCKKVSNAGLYCGFCPAAIKMESARISDTPAIARPGRLTVV